MKYTFTKDPFHVKCSYDLGYQKGLDCGGEGSWEDDLPNLAISLSQGGQSIIITSDLTYSASKDYIAFRIESTKDSVSVIFTKAPVIIKL